MPLTLSLNKDFLLHLYLNPGPNPNPIPCPTPTRFPRTTHHPYFFREANHLARFGSLLLLRTAFTQSPCSFHIRPIPQIITIAPLVIPLPLHPSLRACYQHNYFLPLPLAEKFSRSPLDVSTCLLHLYSLSVHDSI